MTVPLHEVRLRVQPGVVTGLCVDPLLRHERRPGHVVHVVPDVGLAGSGPPDDTDHRHLREENTQKDLKTPSRTNETSPRRSWIHVQYHDAALLSCCMVPFTGHENIALIQQF